MSSSVPFITLIPHPKKENLKNLSGRTGNNNYSTTILYIYNQ